MIDGQEFNRKENIRRLRIVFMGTPEFAVASLDALVHAGFSVVGVITAPDKPAGRGMKLSESAVKKYAVDHGLQLMQPEKLKNLQFLEDLRSLKADVQVVVAFRMLPELVWNMPPKGTINLHASLLPQYRGAAPINWAIINGEKETGVTTFKLQQEIDTGNILMQESIQIGEDETAGELHDRMKITGAKLLVETITGIAENRIIELNQDEIVKNGSPGLPETLKHAPKIFTETCRIDWQKPVAEIHNLIRGLSPFPGAFTTVNGKLLKIFRSKTEKADPEITAGNFLTDQKSWLKFACADGYIHATEVQFEGKKKMNAEEFLRGNKLEKLQ